MYLQTNLKLKAMAKIITQVLEVEPRRLLPNKGIFLVISLRLPWLVNDPMQRYLYSTVFFFFNQFIINLGIELKKYLLILNILIAA